MRAGSWNIHVDIWVGCGVTGLVMGLVLDHSVRRLTLGLVA